jgi:hypothetical protein
MKAAKPRHIREALEEWFAKQSDEIITMGRPVIVELAEILFFASLGAEEKTGTRVGVVWVFGDANDLRTVRADDGHGRLSALRELQGSPSELELAWDVLMLEDRALDVVGITKAAPLADFGRTVLVASGMPGQFLINGVARMNPRTNGGSMCFVFYAEAPGVVSMLYRGKEEFRFERGELIEPPPPIFQEQGPVLDAINQIGAVRQSPWEKEFAGFQFTRIVKMLMEAMSKTQHGGLLLFLPNEPTEEILKRVKLKVVDKEVLSRHARREMDVFLNWIRASAQKPENEAREREKQAASNDLHQIIDDIGRLTAVDNALLIGPDFSVLGAQFEVSSDNEPQIVYEARDVAATNRRAYDMKRHGSRHRAAATFVNQHKGALALLSSADGPLKCFLRVGKDVIMWKVR